MDSGRPVVFHPRIVQAYRSALAEAKAELHALNFRRLCELADLRHNLQQEVDGLCREVDELRAEIQELRSIQADVVKAERERAEGDLASLRKEYERALLRLAQRDGTPLH